MTRLTEIADRHAKEAKELLPCFNVMRVCDACVEKHTGRQIHSPMCPASYRPAVSAALAEKDAEIEMLKSENTWLRRLIQWCHVRLSKDVYREGLLHMLARGVTEADNAKLVQSTLNGEKS